MRIENLLNETQFVNTMDEVSYKDLSPIELSILKKIYDGFIDYDNITDRQSLIVDKLKSLSLVRDEYDENSSRILLTKAGERMVSRRSHDLERLQNLSDNDKPAPFDNRQRKWSEMGGDDQDLERKLKDI